MDLDLLGGLRPHAHQKVATLAVVGHPVEEHLARHRQPRAPRPPDPARRVDLDQVAVRLLAELVLDALLIVDVGRPEFVGVAESELVEAAALLTANVGEKGVSA
mgnify:CR=1 FL=1